MSESLQESLDRTKNGAQSPQSPPQASREDAAKKEALPDGTKKPQEKAGMKKKKWYQRLMSKLRKFFSGKKKDKTAVAVNKNS